MKPFDKHTGLAATMDRANVDTDQIIPARFLKFPRSEGYGQFLFHDVREQPGFILNQKPFDQAKILVANRNFGCGSSREGAPYAFYDCGFRSIIAPSFGDIFFNNCLKNGIVPVRLDEKVCSSLRAFLKDNPGKELTVDLKSQMVDGKYPFSVDPFYREMLLEGVDELGLTQSMLPQIEKFEKEYARATPWLTPTRC